MKYLLLLLLSIKALADPDPDWTTKVGARSTPNDKTTIAVTGAAKDGSTLATKAIQKAIDDCSAKGGGTVTLEPGVYLTGSIFLKQGVELRIDKDVELIGSQHFEDYPEIDTRIAGIEMKWPAALLNIIGVKNAAITGEGKVNARGKFCWDKYWAMRKEYDPKGLRWIVDYDAKRVRTLLVQNAEDITVKDVEFIDAGFWTVQILYSKYVTVDGITVRNNEDGHGPSTDGVDIDSSSWVLVQNCDIDCNDDDFCLKAGRDWDGLRVNRPTEYVVIRHCTARKGGGLLTIGSETSGSIRHVLATDLTAKGTGNGFHIKSATTRGGTVEDIHVRNITMDSVGNAILFTMNWNPAYSYSTLPPGYNPDSIPAHWKTMLHKVEPPEKGTPHFKDIYVSNVKVASAKKAIAATGLESSLISDVHIENTTINAATAGDISYADHWQLDNFSVTTKDGSKVEVKNSTAVTFAAAARRQMEYLGRGVIAVHDGKHIFVSWRLLATDPPDQAFNVYRTTDGHTTKLNKEPLTKGTNFLDATADPAKANSYYITTVAENTQSSEPFNLPANAPPYLSIHLRTPPGYTPNDCSVGDLDGDGEYELVVHQTGRSKDNSQTGVTDPPIIQAYRLDGTFLWQVDLGRNIREGAHYTQFMVYDLDGDGRAEVAMKTADGTIDGKGNVIGDSTKDYRNKDGRILDGPEYFTIFDGRTGEALMTTDYIPQRGDIGAWGGRGGNGHNDSYGNRVDRFLACIAYLDGIHPSVVMCRGYYGRTVLAAWDWRNGHLTLRWVFDTHDGENPYSGMGNHNLCVADVDGDGKDEIIYGSMCVDDNGKGLYTTGLRHGDAVHVGILDPSRPGEQVFGIHEIEDETKGPGSAFFDAATGQILWTGDMDRDVGRGLAADIDPAIPAMNAGAARKD